MSNLYFFDIISDERYSCLKLNIALSSFSLEKTNKYPYSYTGKKKYLFISYDVPEMLINAQKDEDEADR
jgi:hypothetical protein